MTPEQIVRALAAADPTYGHDDGDYCPICQGGARCAAMAVADHDPDCPWRLAVEWVAAQDGRGRCSACSNRADTTVGGEPICAECLAGFKAWRADPAMKAAVLDAIADPGRGDDFMAPLDELDRRVTGG